MRNVIVSLFVVVGIVFGVVVNSAHADQISYHYHFEGMVLVKNGRPNDQVFPTYGDMTFDLSRESLITSPFSFALNNSVCEVRPFYCGFYFTPGSSKDTLLIVLDNPADRLESIYTFPAGTFGSLGTFSGYLFFPGGKGQLTISSVEPVPLPGSAWLFVSAIGIFVTFSKRLLLQKVR